VKRAEKRGKDLSKLRLVLELLVAGRELPATYKDHPLKGDWKGYRDVIGRAIATSMSNRTGF
jgi:mRNA interferase YafQ